MTTTAIMLPLPGCDWSGCGQPGPIEVLITLQGEPSRFAYPVGCYCVGHAVIYGIQAQAHHRGGLWYQPRSPMARQATTTN